MFFACPYSFSVASHAPFSLVVKIECNQLALNYPSFPFALHFFKLRFGQLSLRRDCSDPSREILVCLSLTGISSSVVTVFPFFLRDQWVEMQEN
jgi:hypothetical protein